MKLRVVFIFPSCGDVGPSNLLVRFSWRWDLDVGVLSKVCVEIVILTVLVSGGAFGGESK